MDFEECRLCWALSGDGQKFLSNYQLAEFDEFTVIPALGGLVPGHVMVVSKSHIRAAASLRPQELTTLESQVERLVIHLQQSFKKGVLIFEHGSTVGRGHKACCVQHLHLQLVPFEGEVKHELSTRLNLHAESVRSLAELQQVLCKGPRNYIYVREANDERYVLQPEVYSSQLLRQILASRLGNTGSWDWTRFPAEDEVEETIAGFLQSTREAKSGRISEWAVA